MLRLAYVGLKSRSRKDLRLTRNPVGHVPVYLVRGVGEEGTLLRGGVAGQDVGSGGQRRGPVVRPVVGRLEVGLGRLPLSLLPFQLQVAQKTPVSGGT